MDTLPARFTSIGSPVRVVFGRGVLSELPSEIGALGLSRVLVLCTPGQQVLGEAVAGHLGRSLTVGVHAGAMMHVPQAVAAAAGVEARRRGADGLVAVGGGSTTGLAKAVALETSLPIVAVPTTYAGSEMTSIYGVTADGVKKTGRDARVRPKTVLYDPELTLALPWNVTVTSAFNALAHAAEALYAPDGHPVTAWMAEEGLRALVGALRPLRADGSDPAARAAAFYGAWLCGSVLDAVAMGLHHKLAHTLGGSFDLPHAETHTVLLPHALAYNAPAAPQALNGIGRALGIETAAGIEAPRRLQALAAELGAPTSLRAIGMPEDGLDRAAELAVAAPYPNPRRLERAALRALLQRAFDGSLPASMPPG